MAVSDEEYAMLSNAVYHDKDFISPDGFTIILKANEQEGFYAEAYKRDDEEYKKNNEVIIAYRGSANIDNFIHDYDMWRGKIPPEFSLAMEFYDEVETYCTNHDLLLVGMTGHSLGGSMVQVVNALLSRARNKQIEGVAFAPAGVGGFFPGLDPSYIAVRNYIRKSDLVPYFMDKQLGGYGSYENVYLPEKDQSYEVQYSEGIGYEVLSRRGDGTRIQHKMLGYLVDIAKLQTRPSGKGISYSEMRFADGGDMESGQVSGPGTGTSDSILAWLGNKGKFIRISNGEYVIRANAVQKWGTNFLDSINDGLIPQEFYNGKGSYATGGSISDDSVESSQGNLGEAFRNLALTVIQSIQNYAQELIKQITSGLGLDATVAKSSSAGTLSNAETFPNVRLKQDATGSILTAPQLADYNNELAKTPSLLERIHEASKKTFEAGLSNFLTEGIMKSKNLGEAFRSLAISVLQSIQKIYAEAVTKNIMSMLGFGAKTPETPSSTTSVLGTTDSSGFYYDPNFGIKFAEGGHMQGPGTGTSDSILARLSNGEFIIKASSVQKYGTNFLHSLNNGFVPNNLMPRFATGGLVGASVEGAAAIASSMQSGDVTVPLKVVNVTDPNEVGRYLMTRPGERTMVNFMKNNAGSIRQILNIRG